MNISFRNNISSNYMVVEDVADFSADDFAVKILVNNKIKGLIPMDYETVNGKTNIMFDIASKQSLDNYYKVNKVSFEDYKRIAFSLMQIIKNVKEYLLDADNIVMKKECIFINPNSGIIEFCYYPYYGESLCFGIKELLSNLLSLIDYGDPRVVRIAYDAQKAAVTESFTIDEILSAITNAVSDMEDSYGTYDQRATRNMSVIKEENAEYSRMNAKSESSEKKSPTFFEKAQLYYKKAKEEGTLFDDINELKIIKKIREFDIENRNDVPQNTKESDKKISKDEDIKAKSEKKDKPSAIAEIAEDLDTDRFFEDYKMIQ